MSFPPDDLVNRGFLAARGKLLEAAAFLDRAERHGRLDDFRVQALLQALKKLDTPDAPATRAESFLNALSDPTLEPRPKSDGQAAHGAWKAVPSEQMTETP
ncbi:MAG: hypothetical protein ACFB20_11295 [Opitutales bacterium]